MDLEQELLARFIVFIPKVIVATVVLGLALFLAGLTSRLVSEAVKRRGLNREFTQLFCELTKWGLLLLGVIVALQQVEFDVTAFLTGLGIVGFTIGFALQDVSKNFIAGLLLLLQQPFTIGEIIQVAGFTGKVTAITMRATDLETEDGQIVLIPNATVFTSPIIKNLNRAHLSRPATQKVGG